MPDFKELSIIIVNYRSEQYLKNCVASLFNVLADKIDFEIIIVNNDASGQITDSLAGLPGIKVINQRQNVGFGAANNLGARQARGRLFWFLNPDTEIKASIQGILAAFDKNLTVGIIGPGLVTMNGEVQLWAAGVEADFFDLVRNNLGFPASHKIWSSPKSIETAWVSGGAMFVQKEVFEAVGGFDEKFFMYYEDIDLCRRVRQLGKKVVYHPAVKIKHIGGGSQRDGKTQKNDYYRSQDHYFQKHYGYFTTRLVKALRKIFVRQK